MKKRISGKPGGVTFTPDNGAPIPGTIAMADEPQEEGTPFDPEHVLPDDVAALFGLDDTATPADVFNLIGQFFRFTWRSCSAVTAPATYIREQFVPEGTYTTVGNTLRTASKLSVADDGTVSLGDYTTITLTSTAQTVSNKFLQSSSGTGPIYLGNTGTTVKLSKSGEYAFGGTNPYLVTGVPKHTEYGNVWQYYRSDNINAYPHGQISGNHYYEYLGVPSNLAPGAAQVVTGSYEGTGEFGADKANLIPTPRPPKRVDIYRERPPTSTRGAVTELVESFVWLCKYGTMTPYTNSSVNVRYNVANWGVNFSWYADGAGADAEAQCNAEGARYHYYVIC